MIYKIKIDNPKTRPVNPIGKTNKMSFKKEKDKKIAIKYLFLLTK
ncbi:MAG: hypothetical protein QXD43_03110 [Candidatus Aenigmatarchaeota archaeon]